MNKCAKCKKDGILQTASDVIYNVFLEDGFYTRNSKFCQVCVNRAQQKLDRHQTTQQADSPRTRNIGKCIYCEKDAPVQIASEEIYALFLEHKFYPPNSRFCATCLGRARHKLERRESVARARRARSQITQETYDSIDRKSLPSPKRARTAGRNAQPLASARPPLRSANLQPSSPSTASSYSSISSESATSFRRLGPKSSKIAQASTSRPSARVPSPQKSPRPAQPATVSPRQQSSSTDRSPSQRQAISPQRPLATPQRQLVTPRSHRTPLPSPALSIDVFDEIVQRGHSHASANLNVSVQAPLPAHRPMRIASPHAPPPKPPELTTTGHVDAAARQQAANQYGRALTQWQHQLPRSSGA